MTDGGHNFVSHGPSVHEYDCGTHSTRLGSARATVLVGGMTDMLFVSETTTLSAPATEVWELVGDFGAIADWHPWVPNCMLSSDGRTRTIDLGETKAVEVLLTAFDEELSHTYTVEQGPMPIKNYRATLSVSALPKGCRLTWEAKFEPLHDSAAVQIERFFKKGCEALDARFT
jgi:hypothetical protein